MRVSLDWLKDFVDVREGLDKLQHTLTMIGLEVVSVSEAEGDRILDIEVTPNRPDCLSILGIARELAAANNRQLKIPASVEKNYMKKGPARGGVRVEILDKKACPRYAGCVLKNVRVGLSPKWLVSRLNAIGLRSVNNIVDMTNYVLFELGQPLHAFDLNKLEGKRVVVRRAKKGETIVTIDGVKRDLDTSMLVIADAKKAVAIAGIMGGKDTEISDETRDILIEAAYFDPVSIRMTQRKLGLASESSYRFERGVDIGMILSASARAQELIKDAAGGRAKGTVTDIGGRKIKEREIALHLGEIPRVLGVEINLKKVMDIFNALKIKVYKKTKQRIILKIPSYRQDLEKDIDLIEEVARVYGFDNVPVKIPVFKIQRPYEEEKRGLHSLEKEAKRVLYSLGMNEIITYTLTSRFAVEGIGKSPDNLVRLKNPLSSNQEFMRPGLSSGMLEVVSWNINRKNTLLQLFELNKIYEVRPEDGMPHERMSLCLGMCGRTNGNWKEKPRVLDFFDLKGVVEAFLSSLGVKDYTIERADSFIFRELMSCCLKIDGDVVGELGEVRQEVARRFDIKQKVCLAEICLEDLLRHVNLNRRFRPLPRYPSVKRDISILIDDSVNASEIFNLIKELGGSLVESVNVFDLYKGHQIEQGKKSLAYTLEYRSDERTLKDEEVSHIHKNIQEALVKKLNAQIR